MFKHCGGYISLIKDEAAGGTGTGVYTPLFAEAPEAGNASRP